MITQPVIGDRYRSDHLFLLIGTNPLPNFVAAKLLLKPQGQIYLVHSVKTQPVAERLERYWVEVDHQNPPIRVCVEELNGADVRRRIEGVLKTISSGAIGLNYTGGTKTMSAHAYNTIRDYKTGSGRTVTLSYLDARTNTMFIEHNDEAPFLSEPVLYEVKPTLRDIVQLHNFKLVTDIDTSVVLPDLATTLARVHQDEAAGRSWRQWCDQVLRQNTRKERDWHKENVLRTVNLPLPEEDSLVGVVSAMRQRFPVEQMLPLSEVSQRAGLKKIKHLCEWLDGKWLEHYVFSLVNQIKDDCRIHDAGMGIRPKTEEDRSEYDVDIGVMQGYRLYAISCTTDADRGMCKLKLFEAYLRARNLAGDEAYVALVCMADNPENLEREISRSWDVEGKVRVFGRKHLANLHDHLTSWFTTAGLQGR